MWKPLMFLLYTLSTSNKPEVLITVKFTHNLSNLCLKWCSKYYSCFSNKAFWFHFFWYDIEEEGVYLAYNINLESMKARKSGQVTAKSRETDCVLNTQLSISALITFGCRSQRMMPPMMVYLPSSIAWMSTVLHRHAYRPASSGSISQLSLSSLVTLKTIIRCFQHYDLSKLRGPSKTRNFVTLHFPQSYLFLILIILFVLVNFICELNWVKGCREAGEIPSDLFLEEINRWARLDDEITPSST